jgi:hypothetical protein
VFKERCLSSAVLDRLFKDFVVFFNMSTEPLRLEYPHKEVLRY